MSSETNLIKAALSSVTLHVAVVGGLVAGAIITPPKKPVLEVTLANDTPIVKAAMVNNADVQKQVERLKKEKADAKRAEQLRQKKLKEEQKRIRDLERQRKKKQAEKRAADRAAKKARDEAAKQKKASADAIKKAKAKQKAEAAKAKRIKDERIRQEKAAADAKAKRVAAEKAAKAKAERVRKEKLAKEKAAREQRQREEALAKELAEEQAALNKARQAKVMTEIQKYTSLISATIKRHWVTDQSMKGKECVLNIKLAPSGFVTRVNTMSGDAIVCQSAKAAVIKAGTLPVSKDPQVYAKLKEINLTVQPEFD